MSDHSQHMEHDRGSWGSNFGFLMAAVGWGGDLAWANIWGFPDKMGRYGGFAFLIVYLLLVVFVGAVVMLGELTIGRKTGLGAVGAYGAFNKKHKWVGYIGVASAFFLLTFYNVLGGLVMRYMMGFLLQLVGVDGFSGQEMSFWTYILHDYGSIVFFNILFVVCNIVIVMGGIESRHREVYNGGHAGALLHAALCHHLHRHAARCVRGLQLHVQARLGAVELCLGIL